MKESPKISAVFTVVIPAFNDEMIIGDTLKAIKKALSDVESYKIVVVDDGSADATSDIVKQVTRDAKVIRHKKTLGYGKALLSGLKQAEGDFVVFFDADSSFNPEDIKKLIHEIEHANADVVIGSRFLKPSRKSEKIPLFRVLMSKVIALLTYFLTGVRVTDQTSGFRAIRVDKLDLIHLTSSNSSINSEMVVKAARKGFKISEVPVLYRDWLRS